MDYFPDFDNLQKVKHIHSSQTISVHKSHKLWMNYAENGEYVDNSLNSEELGRLKNRLCAFDLERMKSTSNYVIL